MADKDAMEDEHSRFFMHDGSTANPANFKDYVGSQYEANIAPDIRPIEAPVEKHGREPLPEDRAVPFTSDEETVLDSFGCWHDHVFKLYAESVACLQRMVEHVKAQALHAAHGGEVRAKHETEREPIAQISAR